MNFHEITYIASINTIFGIVFQRSIKLTSTGKGGSIFFQNRANDPMFSATHLKIRYSKNVCARGRSFIFFSQKHETLRLHLKGIHFGKIPSKIDITGF